MAWSVLLLAGLLAAGDFEVQTLTGERESGKLTALSAEQLVLETTSGPKTFPLAGLAAVVQRDAEEVEGFKADTWIELIDGSLLAVKDFVVQGGTSRFQMAAPGAPEVSAKAIRAIHFTRPSDREAKLAKQWEDISQSKAAGDVLITRKDGALDYHEGIEGDIDKDTCKFEIDKDVVAVRRSKVEGIIFFHPAAAELPEGVGEVSLADGTRVTMRGVTIGGGVLKLTTPAGISLELPVAPVERFNFATGKIAFLSDLEPESTNYAPYLGFKEDVPSVRDFYQVRRDLGFGQRPLQLGGKTYPKGLELPSRTTLTYKLPGRFQSFRTMLGIDDSVRETGNIRLAIKGDGKTLWQGDVRGSEPPRELELKIAGVKRLEIVADYGEDLDIGDRLIMADARVTK